MPHSGSFIDDLSSEGRVIITSCDTREVSFKGPLPPSETLRNGDFFVAELFRHSLKGLSLKSSYENAALASMSFSENGNGNGLDGDDSGNGVFSDKAGYHPLLDDNGDGDGSNGQLSATIGNDGAIAANMALCVGVENSGTNGFTNVLAFTALAPDAADPLLFAEVSDSESVGKIWNEIKNPLFTIKISEDDTEQIVMDLPSFAGTFTASGNRFEWPEIVEDGFSGFGQGGKYQVLYFAKDNLIGDNVVYNDEVSQTNIVRNDNVQNTPPPVPLFGPIGGSVVAGAVIVENSSLSDNVEDSPHGFVLKNGVTAQAEGDDSSGITYTVEK